MTGSIDKILKELDLKGVVLVCALENFGGRGDKLLEGVPVRFANPQAPANERLDNLIVVGATDIRGQVAPVSIWSSWIVNAPGWEVNVAIDVEDEFSQDDGTSFGTW